MIPRQYLESVTDNALKELIHSDKHFVEALEEIISMEERTMKSLPARKTKDKRVSKKELPAVFEEAKRFVDGFLRVNPPPVKEVRFYSFFEKMIKFPASLYSPSRREITLWPRDEARVYSHCLHEYAHHISYRATQLKDMRLLSLNDIFLEGYAMRIERWGSLVKARTENDSRWYRPVHEETHKALVMVYDLLCRGHNVNPRKEFMQKISGSDERKRTKFQFPRPGKYSLGIAIFTIAELEIGNLSIYENILKQQRNDGS
ncbi:MAG: hypothetical protein Q8Q01_01670 [archaeon]|nr:hypothetical protein [archaeon]